MEEVDKCAICQTDYMIDVKRLFCGHEFCQQCLIDYNATGDGFRIECPVCQKEQLLSKDGIRGLPAGKDALVEPFSEVSIVEKIPCIVCADDEEIWGEHVASKYCAECDKPMCSEHHKMHAVFHRSHQNAVMDIRVYVERKTKFTKTLCAKHNHAIDGFCFKCRTWMCARCKEYDRDDCVEDGLHDLKHSKTVLEIIRNKFNEAMAEGGSKQEELLKAQKEMNELIENLEQENIEKRELLDKVMQGQIDDLRMNWDRMKQHIDLSMEAARRAAAQFDSDVVEVRVDRLRSLTSQVGSMLRVDGPMEITDKEEQLYAQLTESAAAEFIPPKISLPEILQKLIHYESAVSFKHLTPTGIQFQQVHTNVYNVQSVDHTDAGLVVTSSGDNLTIWPPKVDSAISYLTLPHHGRRILSQAVMSGIVFTLQYQHHTKMMMAFNLRTGAEVRRFKNLTDLTMHDHNRWIAVSSDTLFIIAKVKTGDNGRYHQTWNVINRYNINDGCLIKSKSMYTEAANIILFCPPTFYIVIGTGYVCKYHQDTDEFVWKYDRILERVTAATVDDSQRCWIFLPRTKGCCILSSDGELLITLDLKRTPGDSFTVTDMSVFEDQLLLATGEGLREYTVHRF